MLSTSMLSTRFKPPPHTTAIPSRSLDPFNLHHVSDYFDYIMIVVQGIGDVVILNAIFIATQYAVLSLLFLSILSFIKNNRHGGDANDFPIKIGLH